MSGIALFVPSDEMYSQAQEILAEKDHHVAIVKKIKTEEAVAEAQKAIAEGVNIIVARGRQAMEIRCHTNVVVAEIMMTAQELGLLIIRAKDIVGKSCPRIGIFGWGNMLCDTTYFNQIYQVDLRRYLLKDKNEWRNVIEKAMMDHIDIIIGGEISLEYGRQAGIPGLYLSSTGEAIRLALQNAESLYYMSEIEQHHYAQFSTILDNSFGGFIKASVAGKVLVMNRVMERILGCSQEQVVGQPVLKILKGLEEAEWNQVLEGKSDNYSTFLTIQDQSVVISVEAVKVGSRQDGVIVSCNRLKRLDINDRDVMKEQYLRGYVAHGTFDDIDRKLKGMRKVVEIAKIYAQSSSPVLVEAISGPELDAIVQGIHNYSMRRNGPFIMINMAGMTQDEQRIMLFGTPGTGKEGGEPGMLAEANHGTLVIQGIDKMTLPNQYKLAQLIRTKRLVRGSRFEDTQMVDTRIIACTAKNLTELRSNFQFRSDLYFTFKSLRIKIPNLKDRREDVEYLLEKFIDKYMKQYSRYHVVTAAAKRVLLEYPWEGNSIQLEAFCERMILTVGRRTITEEYVRDLLEELYHQDSSIYATTIQEEGIFWKQESADVEPTELDLIRAALHKYKGSRVLVAKELGISTTTLWRKLKKYGLSER